MVKLSYMLGLDGDILKTLMLDKIKQNKQVASRIADMALLLMEKELRNRLGSVDDLGLKNRTDKLRQMSNYLYEKSKLMEYRNKLQDQLKTMPPAPVVPALPAVTAASYETPAPDVKESKKEKQLPPGKVSLECPTCGYEMYDKSGVAAWDIKCPICNSPMKRKLPVL